MAIKRLIQQLIAIFHSGNNNDMEKNESKNLKRLKNLKKFTKDRQPSPEAKSRGWERRREAQQLLDMIKDMGDMSMKEIQDMLNDVQVHPEKYTLKQVKIAQYLSKEKFMVDYLDRHIPKAPQNVDVTSGGEKIDRIAVEIVNKHDRKENPED